MLGSVNPLLVRNISESLAGRIGFIELGPFQYSEAAKWNRIGIEGFWLKGGYTEPIAWGTKVIPHGWNNI